MRKLLFLLPLLLNLNCKKDVPTGKMKAILGKWNWVCSDMRKYGYHNRLFFDYRRWPENGESYQMEFRTNGKVYLTENGKTKHIRMEISDQTIGDTVGGHVDGRGLSKMSFRFLHRLDKPDTLWVYAFPFNNWGQHVPINIFVREH